ncbi:MAG: alpha/beta fold hydrolase, partial [Rhodocyclales bacterium]|nr:alpha/beta fold hydrolase [Rhodocyclales bacterium]
MHTTYANHPVYLYTGGRPVDPQLPLALFIHGAGHDHSVWNHQARHLAHHGHAVLVPDHPGHGASGGAPLASIEALSDWIVGLLDHLGVEHVALIGHSMGSLIALEAAARAPQRATHLAMLGSCVPMPVPAVLLELAKID